MTRAGRGRRPRGEPRRGRRALTVLLAVVATLVAIGALAVVPRLVGDEQERSGLAEFYRAPAGAAEGAPGSVVRVEPMRGDPLDADAWRIMYRTTDVHGERVLATGVVIAPRGTPPSDGRTVLAWGHPTSGTAEQCAPSRSFDPFIDVEGMRMMLDRGYTIVATDYVGMGTAGPDSYLVGVTAGNSVLDSVRAAREIPDAGAGTSVILWGHSQGGQAALFAAERAEAYAPELGLTAVAVAAPAADLTALLQGHLDDVSGATIGSYAFEAYAQVYRDRGAALDSVLTSEAQRVLPRMNELCLLTDLSELHRIAQPVVGDFFAADPGSVEPWATLLRENSAGAAFDAPLFVAQGMRDRLVLPDDTEQFVEHEREQGIEVDFHPIAEADHGTVAYLALPALDSWLDSLGV